MHAYIAQLPKGLDSYPECQAKGSVFRKVYEYSEQRLEGLPQALQEALDTPPTSTSYFPQCHALALIVGMVEARMLPSEEEAAWVVEAATHLFASPMYRILMFAATPKLVFKSAHLRWGAFFKGTKLKGTVAGREADLHLTAPERMFNDDLADIFVHVISAAVNYTKDENRATLEFIERVPTGLRYRGTW
jgi:hypothetical protein